MMGGEQCTDDDFRKAMKILATRALQDSDPLTRKHAVYMLGIARNPDCIRAFIQALRDTEKGVRGQAAQALALLGTPALQSLVDLLDDEDWKVRYRAAEAIGLLGTREAENSLIRALNDNRDHVRYMAAKGLGVVGTVRAVAPLTILQTDENPYVRDRAARSIGNIGQSDPRG
jgi:HEAT repeat protein